MIDRTPAVLLAVVLIATGCKNSRTTQPDVSATPDEVSRDVAGPDSVVVGGERPRYDASGDRITHITGKQGARNVAIVTLSTSDRKVFETPSDDIDPTWTLDGRLLFSSNRAGTYDLWLLDPVTETVEQVTKLEGDELAATVAPVEFGFYAVQNGMCGSPASGKSLDTYQKALFTRRVGDSSEVWFTSVVPKETDSTSEHSAHQGRVSAAGKSCTDPAFSGDGLSVVWSCDSAVEQAAAEYAQTFQAALDAVKGDPPVECQGDADFAKCLPKLERRYAKYPGVARSKPDDGLSRPSISANQTLLIADRDGAPMQLERFNDDAAWKPLGIEASPATGVVWSPSGKEVAFASNGEIQRADTDFYLQTVRNLHEFPELFGAKGSSLLQANRFVARPAAHKEFHALHEKLRYEHRPQFITTDVALQVFRDEFLRMIETAEADAAAAILQISKAMMDHYVARFAKGGTPIDRYYAVLFATAYVPLQAAHTMEKASADDLMMQHYDADSVDDSIKQLNRPVAERLPEEIPRIWPEVPDSIRGEVKANVSRMLAHQGIEELEIPGMAKPFKVDFSQFKIRGAYAENELGAYFLAMNWYGNMPLPIAPSIAGLTSAMQSIQVGNLTAYERYRRVDAMVGSFMGRPVDATVHQVVDALEGTKFDAVVLTKRLAKVRGEVPIRDANGGDRAVMVTLFPKRVGLDVTFFRALTHPKVQTRGMPTSLDVFAATGNERATKHAADAAPAMAEAYQKALQELAGRTPSTSNRAFWSTDIYHSWLAALVALATPLDVPMSLEFARNDAWRDRQLYGALAGYTQLKHSAVLYAMQDIGVECGDDSSFFVAVERPLVPAPVGFVEPNVAFYDALAALAKRAYVDMTDDPNGPSADRWADENDPRLNAMSFAVDLAGISRSELAGRPLTTEQARSIEFIGGRLELLTLRMDAESASYSTGGGGREDRGVALVTDIHTNSQRAQALHVGVGRIFDMWVVVPSEVGERLTQGGILSFYEFTQPMSDRLTDTAWNDRIEAGKLPKRPSWTQSFIEEQ